MAKVKARRRISLGVNVAVRSIDSVGMKGVISRLHQDFTEQPRRTLHRRVALTRGAHDNTMHEARRSVQSLAFATSAVGDAETSGSDAQARKQSPAMGVKLCRSAYYDWTPMLP